jgi:hypothetical protein
MSVLTRNPTNQNPLHPNKFQINFSRVPNVRFFAQSVAIPGISMSEVLQPTPFVDVYAPGEKAIYDLINITFIVDENMESWIEIHDWIRGMTFPKEFSEYRNLGNLNSYTRIKKSEKPQYSDCEITILSSSNNPNVRFKFYDVFPTTLSTIVLNSTDSPDTILTADATFRYSYYDIEQLY